MKTKLLAIIAWLFILSGSIFVTILLSWAIFPFIISPFSLEVASGLSASSICRNMNQLMLYLLNPFNRHLVMSHFAVSHSGQHHFVAVKSLFILVEILFFGSMPVFIIYVKGYIKPGFAKIHRFFFIKMAILPIFVAMLAIVIGFDTFFTLFHTILFIGDDTWLFNPVTDPIITVLPQPYFMLAFAIFFVLYEVVMWLLIVVIKYSKDLDTGNRKVV